MLIKFPTNRKFFLIAVIAIVVLALILVGSFVYFYIFKPKTYSPETSTVSELKEAYSALAKIESIDPANSLIKAEVGLPRPDFNQKSQSKEFSLRIASSTYFKNNSSLSQLKPDDLVYIETRENILNPGLNSLTLTSLQRIESINKNNE